MKMEALERRLDRLEKKIVGGANKASVPANSASTTLVNVAKKCGNEINNRERIAPLMRRTAELERYLDPSFGEQYGGVSAEVKADLILAHQDQIRRTADLLGRVAERKKVLDSQSFGSAAELEPKLAQLTKIQVEQEEKCGVMTQETLDLIGQYNEIMETLSKGFVEYDRLISAAELKANPPKDLNK